MQSVAQSSCSHQFIQITLAIRANVVIRSNLLLQPFCEINIGTLLLIEEASLG